MLVALSNGRRVEAARVKRDELVRCPGCGSDLILRAGRIRVAHFAHRPRAPCDFARGETLAHLEAKLGLRDALAARGLRAEVEYEVAALAGDRRADVLVWSPAGQAVAIELQHTPIGVPEIERRSFAYAEAGVPVLWIPFLTERFWQGEERRAGGAAGDVFNPRYPARPWELWAQGFGRGVLWYFDPLGNRLWRGRLDQHPYRARPALWYTRRGEERRTPGGERISRRWWELTLWGPYGLDAVRIELLARTPARAGDFLYPGGRVARFTA